MLKKKLYFDSPWPIPWVVVHFIDLCSYIKLWHIKFQNDRTLIFRTIIKATFQIILIHLGTLVSITFQDRRLELLNLLQSLLVMLDAFINGIFANLAWCIRQKEGILCTEEAISLWLTWNCVCMTLDKPWNQIKWFTMINMPEDVVWKKVQGQNKCSA